MNILVVTNNQGMAKEIRSGLTAKWSIARVSFFTRSSRVVSRVMRTSPDVILIDKRLPDGNGMELLTDLRDISTSIIFLIIDHDDDASCVQALELGADDVLRRPISHIEMWARIGAAMRRASGPKASGKVGRAPGESSLQINLDAQLVKRGDRSIQLTPLEWEILKFLGRREGNVVMKDTLVSHLRATRSRLDDSSLKVYIHRLRKKLGDNPDYPQVLRSFRGMGYGVVLPEP